MKLTTSFDIPKHYEPIAYGSKMLLLGSCFSQNIGDKLTYYGFDATVNPFGVIFNPHSLMVLMDRSINEGFTTSDVSGTFSYLAHSDLDGHDRDETLANLKEAGERLKTSLQTATHLIITLGTAWVYELKETGEIVANCHQQPQKLFKKRLLSIREIQQNLEQIKSLITALNPEIQMIFTLSPVRHTRDGMVENNRSKSRLHDAIQTICESKNTYYFPSFEILMDELRDYRFYAGDMIHPNATAVDYVWNRFRESVLNTSTAAVIKATEKYRKLAAHRPKDITAHELQLSKMKMQLLQDFPYLKLQ